jgi:hypothetical protein
MVPRTQLRGDEILANWKVVARGVEGTNFDVPPACSGALARYAGGTALVAAEQSAAMAAQDAIESEAGFLADPRVRAAVEDRAMGVATEMLGKEGWRCEDVSRQKIGYDLECRRGDLSLKVEVKGTQTAGNVLTVTENEVQYARLNSGKVCIALVHSISVAGNPPIATGGTYSLVPWSGEAELLRPISYRLTFRKMYEKAKAATAENGS